MVLMRGHGFTFCGRSVVRTVSTAVKLPRNARTLLTALALRGPVVAMSESEMASVSGAGWRDLPVPDSPAERRGWNLWLAEVGLGRQFCIRLTEEHSVTPSEKARRQAVLASRARAAAGQGDMVWGHVATRDPEGRGIWIKAPGWGLEEVREDRLQLVSFDGEVSCIGFGNLAAAECPIHLEVLSARPELECSVHTHSRSAVSFAALDPPLLPISHQGAL